jgi:hypothetical protein
MAVKAKTANNCCPGVFDMESPEIMKKMIDSFKKKYSGTKDDDISKFVSYWGTLTSSDPALPCIKCFIRYNEISPIGPIVTENEVERVKCKICKEIFYLD